jgi:hypothetical protein
MSLVSLALRIAVTESLKGRTLAEGRVADSELAAISDLIGDSPSPLIVVSVDDASGERDKAGLALLDAADEIGLLFEIAIASRVSAEAKDAAGGVSMIAIEPSSKGLEVSLDLLWRQVSRALLTPLDGEPWGDIARQLILRTNRFQMKRGGEVDGSRVATRFYLVSVEPIAEPDFGRPAEGVWAELIAAMEQTAGLTDLSRILRAAIEQPAGLADWRVVQARLGLPETEVRALGIAPPYPADPEDPPTLESYQLLAGLVDPDAAEIVDGPQAQD